MGLKEKTLAIIGVAYVGLPLAVAFGKRRPVIGFDINPQRVAVLHPPGNSGGDAVVRPVCRCREQVPIAPASSSAIR